MTTATKIRRRTPRDANGVALYRLFDATGDLLYVGISNAPGARFMEHKADKDWWPLVADHVIVWHATRREALDAESRAIWYEKPIHNKDRPWTKAEEAWFYLARQHPELVTLEDWCLKARSVGIGCIWPDVLREIHNIIDPTPRGGELSLLGSVDAFLATFETDGPPTHPSSAIRVAVERLEALLPVECVCPQCLCIGIEDD